MHGRKFNNLPVRFRSLAFVLILFGTSTACVLSFSTPGSTERVQDSERLTSSEAENDLQTEVAVQSTQLSVLATQVRNLELDLETQAGLIRYLATQRPAVLPTPSAPPRPTPYLPLRGNLEIEDGKCCVGGIAGETITVQVSFFAESPFGEVTSMRVTAGNIPHPPEAFEQVPWQTFTPTASFEIPIVLNWTGFYIQVQYQDALGNLSPVYVDDISVEGMPAPTPTK